MFIRRKITDGAAYYDLAESYRENGEVKKRILVSLGHCSSIAEALRRTEYQLRRHLANAYADTSRGRNKSERLSKRLEMLQIVLTKGPQLQTANSSYTENLQSIEAAVRP